MIKGYYFITDSGLSRRGDISDIKNAVAAGVKVVQYRDKCRDSRTMHLKALKLRKLCKGITFLVNDRVDIALSAGADGVHLGQDDLPYSVARKLLGKKGIIGLTAHNLREAREAEKLGADYIGVSPIFRTTTKPDAGRSSGVALIRNIKKNINIPVIAIGGIDLSNAEEIVHSGADGLCAISAVITRPDVKSEIRKFQKLYKNKGGVNGK